MPLDQAIGLQLGIRVGHRGAMHAKVLGQLAAGGNAVARAQLAAVDHGAKLVANLKVKRDVTFGLELQWQHWLSPTTTLHGFGLLKRANMSPET